MELRISNVFSLSVQFIEVEGNEKETEKRVYIIRAKISGMPMQSRTIFGLYPNSSDIIKGLQHYGFSVVEGLGHNHFSSSLQESEFRERLGIITKEWFDVNILQPLNLT